MKICLLTTQVPFIKGGAEVLTECLANELRARNHSVEIIALPFTSYPAQSLEACIEHTLNYNLDSYCDRVIGLKFPTYYFNHKKKSMWLMHQHREFYDLWDNPVIHDYRISSGISSLRDRVIELDTRMIPRAEKLYTISSNVSKRLKQFNNIDAIPMSPPPADEKLFRSGSFENYILVPSRIGPLKRQELLIRALAKTSQPVKLVFLGAPDSIAYGDHLKAISRELGVEDRIEWLGYVSQEKKIELYANCKAVAFIPVDEDMGYIAMEAALSRRPILSCVDSGGPLEFAKNEINGWVVNPTESEIAHAMDSIWSSPTPTLKRLGENGFELYQKQNISWNTILERLI